MAFKKLYKVIQDGCLGFQTVNQHADNCADLRTQLLVQHGSNDHAMYGTIAGFNSPGGALPPAAVDYRRLGKHNLPEIPRTVLQTTLYLANTSTVPQIGSEVIWGGPGIPMCWRIGVGQYLLPVIGLGLFWGKATALVGASISGIEPQVRVLYSSQGGNNALSVTTYQLDTGDFVPADQSFTLALYGIP